MHGEFERITLQLRNFIFAQILQRSHGRNSDQQLCMVGGVWLLGGLVWVNGAWSIHRRLLKIPGHRHVWHVCARPQRAQLSHAAVHDRVAGADDKATLRNS